jgi:hypothetical protein
VQLHTTEQHLPLRVANVRVTEPAYSNTFPSSQSFPIHSLKRLHHQKLIVLIIKAHPQKETNAALRTVNTCGDYPANLNSYCLCIHSSQSIRPLDYRLNDRDSIFGKCNRFFSVFCGIQTYFGARPVTCPMGTGGSIARSKAAGA